jgi:hypothetical protein
LVPLGWVVASAFLVGVAALAWMDSSVVDGSAGLLWVGGVVVFFSMESLILAQDERWRRA